MRTLAFALVWGSRNEEAFRWASEAERIARQTGDEEGRTEALMVMARTAPSMDEALALWKQAVQRLDTAGHRVWAMTLTSGLAYLAVGLGDYRAAQRLSADALERATTCGAREELVAAAQANAALAALFAGDLTAAQQGFANEVNAGIRLMDDILISEGLTGLAAIAAASGRDELAARLHGAADATGHAAASPVIGERLDERFFAPARERLGKGAWDAAHAAGRALKPSEALAISRSVGSPSGAVSG
jgi:hypothetical protein